MLFLVKESLPPFSFFHVPIKSRLQEIIFKNFQNDPCWVSNQSSDHFVFTDAKVLGSLPGHVTNAEPENSTFRRGPCACGLMLLASIFKSLILSLFFNHLFIFVWRISALRYCVGFCRTSP